MRASRAIVLAACLCACGRSAPGASAGELVAEGNRLLEKSDFDGAVDRYGRAQALRPNSPEVDLNLGLTHYRKGDEESLGRAAEYFAAAAGKDGGRLASAAHYALGGARVGQGRFEDALEEYLAALDADPSNDDARANYEIVQRHIDDLKKREEERRKAEEEFRKRIEELMKELVELVQAQAEAVACAWASDPSSRGPELGPEDGDALKKLADEKKPLPDDLAARLARSVVAARDLTAEAVGPKDLGGTEVALAGRAHKAAVTAALLAEALKKAGAVPSGPAAGQHGSQAQPPPPENPLATALERAGGAAEVGAGRLREAGDALSKGNPEAFRAAEPAGALAMQKLMEALGELAGASKSGGDGQGQGEKADELLKRLADIRARQGALVRDVWSSLAGSRGPVAGPAEQKAFWEKVRAGEEVAEDERAGLARIEIFGSGPAGERRQPTELAGAQGELAGAARALATEIESLAASSGGAGQAASLAGMLGSAAEAMDDAAAKLPAGGPSGPQAEAAAVLAFVRLTRSPTQLDEILMRLGTLLAEQMVRILDTWKSDAAARGPVPAREEMEAAREAVEKAVKGEAALDPDLEAKLGRMAAAMAERASGGAAGEVRAAGAASKLQLDAASRAREASADMKKLALAGRAGETNPAAGTLEGSAVDVDSAVKSMEAAGGALARSFAEAEPDQARATAALVRALARFASGASGEGERSDQARQDEERKGDKPDTGEERPEDDRGRAAKDRPREKAKREEISKKQAEQLLDEVEQDERELRRDARKLRGGKPVEVRRDW